MQLTAHVWREYLALASAALLPSESSASSHSAGAPSPAAGAVPPAGGQVGASAAANPNPDPDPSSTGWSGWGEGGQRAPGSWAPHLSPDPKPGTGEGMGPQGAGAAGAAPDASGDLAEDQAVDRAARFGGFARLFRRFAGWQRSAARLQPLQAAEETLLVRPRKQ